MSDPESPLSGSPADRTDAPPAPLAPLPEGVRCTECGYHLFGLTSARCPECGALIMWRKTVPRVGAAWPRLLAAGMGTLSLAAIPDFFSALKLFRGGDPVRICFAAGDLLHALAIWGFTLFTAGELASRREAGRRRCSYLLLTIIALSAIIPALGAICCRTNSQFLWLGWATMERVAQWTLPSIPLLVFLLTGWRRTLLRQTGQQRVPKVSIRKYDPRQDWLLLLAILLATLPPMVPPFLHDAFRCLRIQLTTTAGPTSGTVACGGLGAAVILCGLLGGLRVWRHPETVRSTLWLLVSAVLLDLAVRLVSQGLSIGAILVPVSIAAFIGLMVLIRRRFGPKVLAWALPGGLLFSLVIYVMLTQLASYAVGQAVSTFTRLSLLTFFHVLPWVPLVVHVQRSITRAMIENARETSLRSRTSEPAR